MQNRVGLFVGLGDTLVKLGFYKISKKVRPAGLALNPGPFGLGLLVYLAKARSSPTTQLQCELKNERACHSIDIEAPTLTVSGISLCS
jgi:hypothetical protein